jgi:hypothetical protein
MDGASPGRILGTRPNAHERARGSCLAPLIQLENPDKRGSSQFRTALHVPSGSRVEARSPCRSEDKSAT